MRTTRALACSVFITLVFLLRAAAGIAGTAHLVKDINANLIPVSSNPAALGHLGNTFVFGADLADQNTVGALVQTDGTAAGTTVIKTFDGHGVIASPPVPMIRLGSKAIFIGYDNPSNMRVWVTDGTSGGTQRLTDQVPGSPDTIPTLIGEFNGEALFSQLLTDNTVQLFLTNGTPAGTRAITQFPLVGDNNGINSVQVANGKIYFLRALSAFRRELWVSTGTPGSAQQLFVIDGSPFNGVDTGPLVLAGNHVFFVGSSLTYPYRRQLHAVDTTTDVVTRLDLSASADAGVLPDTTPVALGGVVLFLAQAGDGDNELWRSDGTPGGTSRVINLNPTASAFDPVANQLISVNGRALFSANDGTHGQQLWSSDGTAQNTVPVISGTPVPNSPGSNIAVNVAILGTTAYYAVANGVGREVWITDGTPAGTRKVPGIDTFYEGEIAGLRIDGDSSRAFINVTDFDPATSIQTSRLYRYDPAGATTTFLTSSTPLFSGALFTVDNGLLYFTQSSQAIGDEPWVSDGTVAGTHLLKELAPQVTSADSSPASFAELNGKLFFSADDGNSGRELWQSDGTSAGTQRVADLVAGAGSSNPYQLFSWNGAIYFFATDASNVQHFMRFVGANSAIETLATLSGPLLSPPCTRVPSVVLGGRLVFVAADSTGHFELWSTDGTAAGTTKLTQLDADSRTCGLTVMNGRIYFGASTTADGPSLWSTDGTTSGTQKVFGNWTAFDVMPVSGTVYRNELYFIIFASGGSLQLWKTDGTEANTRSFTVGNGTNTIPAGVLNDKLVLVGQNGVSGPGARREIWISDGTSAGTMKLDGVDIPAQAPVAVTPSGVYFAGTDAAGTEPWISDGTAAGTYRLADLNSGSGNSSPVWFVNFNGVTIFQARDASGTPTIFRTDSTAAGTVAAGSVPARSSSTTQAGPFVAGQNLYFVSTDSTAGDELFAVPNLAPQVGNDTATSTNSQAVTVSVLANDADSDGRMDPASVKVTTAPQHGTTAVAANGQITYTPAAAFAGTDTFSYSAADDQGSAATGTVTVTVSTPPPTTPPPSSGGSSGGGGALNVWQLLALAALLLWRLRRGSRAALRFS
jgi:ELWxxDGT repeat protein